MYGMNVYNAVIKAGEKETGVTIHRVSAEYDSGEIVAQTKAHYTREWIDGKLQFMLGQLKSWSDEKIFTEFEKQI